MLTKLKMKYAGVYFFYYICNALIGGFVSAFLLSKGYSSTSIGTITATASILASLLQPALADLADRTKKLTKITAGISFVLFCLVLPLLFLKKGIILSLIYIMAYAVNISIQPLVYALCYRLQDNGYYIPFAPFRSIGSCTYGLAMTAFGSLVVSFGYGILPITAMVTIAIAIAFMFSMRQELEFQTSKENEIEEEISFGEFVKRNKVFLVFCLGVVLQSFSGATGVFMQQIVNNLGGDTSNMGIIVGISACSEIPALLFYEKIHSKLPYQKIIWLSCAGYVTKITLFLLAKSITTLYIAAGFQMFSFGLFLPSYVGYLNEIMDKREAIRGQATCTAAMTMTGVISNLVGGLVIDHFGVPALLKICCMVTILGATIIITIMPKMKKA